MLRMGFNFAQRTIVGQHIAADLAYLQHGEARHIVSVSPISSVSLA
jgi:hypothetical protein